MSGHIVSIRIYLLIFTALLVLTGVTIYVAFLDLGVMNTVVALAIAGVKAALVVLYFMHLRYGSSLTKLFWVAGLLWLAILLVLTMNDYLTRGWFAQPEGWTGLLQGRPAAKVSVAPPGCGFFSPAASVRERLPCERDVTQATSSCSNC